MPSSYRHTQPGVLSLVGFALGLLLIAGIGFWAGWPPVLLFAAAVLLVCAVIFSSLTVEIRDGWVECRFGTGLIRKRFALRDIREARPVRNRWYHGWGIRYTPHGWLFNVSGLDAVELTLASGKTFRVGTDQPEELTAAIRQAAG